MLLPTEAEPRVSGTAAAAGGERLGVWSRDGRLRVEAVAVNGRAVQVEFRVRPDLVVISRAGSVQACLDRAVLGAWLAGLDSSAQVELVCDEATLSVGAQGRVALSLAEGLGRAPIQRWELSPSEAAALRERI